MNRHGIGDFEESGERGPMTSADAVLSMRDVCKTLDDRRAQDAVSPNSGRIVYDRSGPGIGQDRPLDIDEREFADAFWEGARPSSCDLS
jgi:hypothetical protein